MIDWRERQARRERAIAKVGNEPADADPVEWALWQADYALADAQGGPCTIGPTALQILVGKVREALRD